MEEIKIVNIIFKKKEKEREILLFNLIIRKERRHVSNYHIGKGTHCKTDD